MTSLLHRVFPFMATNAEIKLLHSLVSKGITNGSSQIDAQSGARVRNMVDTAAKKRDVDALRAYARISPGEHALVTMVVPALREALGIRKVAHLVTVEHATAIASILTAYLHASNMTKARQEEPIKNSVHDLAVVAFRNYDRMPDCLSAIYERYVMDPKSLTETLSIMKTSHPSLSVGAL